MQALSGTGSLRVAGEFYAKFLPAGTTIYVSDPTWGNHSTSATHGCSTGDIQRVGIVRA